MQEIKSRYYTVKQIKQLENCGKDKAYELAKQLPHEKRGKGIYVFAEDYDNYYEEKRQKAKSIDDKAQKNIYQIRKFS